MLLYYITDRTQFPGDEATRRHLLLDKIAEAAACGIDFIQLREKDLPTQELESMACEALRVVGQKPELKARLLINSRADVAISSGADGVHLRSGDISPGDVRLAWSDEGPAGERAVPVIAVSCHSLPEVERAKDEGADLVVFGPVFEKKNEKKFGNVSVAGIDLLRQACQYKIPVLALGGITVENARACVDAGAAGIAAIRLFQENEIAEVVRRLRA